MVGIQELAKLLDGPLRGRVRGDVLMQDAARASLHGHEDVHDTTGRGDRLEEIADHDRFRMVADEGAPA